MRYSDIIKEIKEPRQLFLKVLHRYPEIFKWMDDETYLKFVYRIALGKKLNLNNPKTFNEKLQWLKLNDRKDIYTTMVDKYEAKKYVAERIGEEHIIPTLGVWNHFDEIDFNALPDQFVLKCTHDSGGLVICTDKSKFDREAAQKKIEHSLKRNFYWFGREWPYKNVPARIIAEKYMSEDENNTESSVLTDFCCNNKDRKALVDYKFFCFDGEVKCLYVSDTEKHLLRFYDATFNPLDVKRDDYKDFDTSPRKPIMFEQMKLLAEKLSFNIPHVRVDFYEINGNIYFGEMTFYTGSGFIPFKERKWDLALGELIVLPH